MPDMDMRNMQEEAARRMREMQSRARSGRRQNPPQGGQNNQGTVNAPGQSSAQSAPGPQNQTQSAPNDRREEPQRPAALPAQSPPASQSQLGQPPPSLLEELFKDRERTVLLALLLLLGGEGGNDELMFALLFLLM